MKTYSEFMEDQGRAAQTADDRAREGRLAYVHRSDVEPVKAGVHDHAMRSLVKDQTLHGETELTDICCDRCGYQVVVLLIHPLMMQGDHADAIRALIRGKGAKIVVACGACGFSAAVPHLAPIGADWESFLPKGEPTDG